MKCRQAARFLVDREVTGNNELADHLATCHRCSELAKVIDHLSRAGHASRQRDLSNATINETRLQAAALISGNRARAGRPELAPIPSLRFLPRPAMAALAAACLLVAVSVFGWMSLHRRDMALSPGEITSMDSSIAFLAGQLDSQLNSFASRYSESEAIGSVEALTSALSADIASCVTDIRTELQGAGKPGDNATGQDDRT